MEFAWLLLAAMLVFLMQAGFLCLETGKVRSKNSINVAAKNITDFILASTVFWVFGFSVMFGESWLGIVGSGEYLFGAKHAPYQISFFLFQMMFCGTAATLLSGAVAERMSFRGYVMVTLILSSFIYPVVGHWGWSSVYTEDNSGWLESLGFVDFAGATIVHSVGGWVALAAIIIIGPRTGRFDSSWPMPVGNNLPFSALGVLLIWLGWFGFNGGSTLLFGGDVPGILLNTCLGALWGGLSASVFHYLFKRFTDVTFILNGVIAGLVSVTAAVHAISPAQSAFAGIVAGALLYFACELLEQWRLDDVLSVIPAHLVAGIWGTLLVGIMGDPQILGTGLAWGAQVSVQLLGIVTIGAFSFGVSFALFRLINRFIPLRISVENEQVGMNISEHRASTELLDLLTSMKHQENQGKFEKSVLEEPFTEVGQIAKQYNRVINRVNHEMDKRDSAIDKFRQSEMRKSAILDSSMDSILTINCHAQIMEFNAAAERTFGFQRKQVLNQNLVELFIPEESRNRAGFSLKHKFAHSEGLLINRRNSISLMRSSGDTFPAEVTITDAAPDGSKSKEYTLHIRDVTRQQKLQLKLKQLAYSDPLTGLYNRTWLLDSLKNALHNAQNSAEEVALFFLDLDRFKKINDTLGHKAGDELLREVANRLTSVTREQDTIARWGGDEFIVMMQGDLNDALIQQKAMAILQVMREPVALAGRELTLPTSIGVSVATSDTWDAEQLIQHADIAMYCAKQQGRDNFQLFKAEMADNAKRNFDYEQEMRKALADESQFYMVYQPKYDVKRQMVGMEALVRWQHPVEGLIAPIEFIPLAEESDLILALGHETLRQTLQQMSAWRQQGYELLPVAVNLSGKHLVSQNLLPCIEQLLERYQISGSLLEIEITEGVLLQDVNRCIDVLNALKKLEIKVSVDDFGTGYSSLNYLKRLPLDVLKIDRSFVKESTSSHEDHQICSTIIKLAESLGLQTVAEGVETEEQYLLLLDQGCAMFQGYYFSKPLKQDEVSRLFPQHAMLDVAN